jgi:hypothetical protein
MVLEQRIGWEEVGEMILGWRATHFLRLEAALVTNISTHLLQPWPVFFSAPSHEAGVGSGSAGTFLKWSGRLAKDCCSNPRAVAGRDGWSTTWRRRDPDRAQAGAPRLDRGGPRGAGTGRRGVRPHRVGADQWGERMQAEEPSDGCARVIVPCFLQDERFQHARAAATEDKDGNGYPLFVCPRVKSRIWYPRIFIKRVEKIVFIPDTRIPVDMWDHTLDNIYSLGFIKLIPPHSATIFLTIQTLICKLK